MKVCHTSEIFTFQKTLILQLQLTLELSQFQEIFSTYTDFLFLFAEYLYLFKIFKNEINSLQGKNALFKNNFITQAPARDGGNWYTYSIEYYKNNAGGNTAMVKYDGEWWYTYDKNGNRTAKGKVKLTNGSSYIPYSDNNPGCREGNVVIDKSYEYWEYTWDLNNRLTKVEQKKDEYDDELVCVEYTYDALNFRISRKSTLEGTLTRYAYGRNGALSYEEFSKDDAVVGSRSYAYFNNQVIGFTDTQGTTEQKRYAVTDILGTVTQIYSENNELLWDNSYTAFGIPDVATTDKFEDIFEFYGMFTGCQYDNETGLTYHWNRWRSESGNYFISVDAQRDGDNWYVYCGQNPLTRYDKSGLNWMDREGNLHSNSETGINYNITYTIPNIQTPEEKIPNPNAYLTNSNLSGDGKRTSTDILEEYRKFQQELDIETITKGQLEILYSLQIEYNLAIIAEGNLSITDYVTNGVITTGFDEAQDAVDNYQVNSHYGIDIIGGDLKSPFFLQSIGGKEFGSNDKIFSIVGTDLKIRVKHGDKGQIIHNTYSPGDKIMSFPKFNNANIASTGPHFHIDMTNGTNFINPLTFQTSTTQFKQTFNGGETWSTVIVNY